MVSIDLFQHQILCLVSIIIITSGLENFPGFPFISDTKERRRGSRETIVANSPGSGGGISPKTFDLHCLFLWLLKAGSKGKLPDCVPWKPVVPRVCSAALQSSPYLLNNAVE